MAEDETKIEYQDSPDEMEELRKRLDDIEMSLGVFNPRNMAGLRTKDLQQATRANLFGDGSDGDVVVSTEIDLTRDMFYNNLTVEEGGIINTKSFRIFAKDQFIKKPGGIVRNNGNNGTAGGDGAVTPADNTGGAAGATVASGSLPGGIVSGDGGNGAKQSTAAEKGDDGTDAAKSLGSAGSGGGGGGYGTTSGGAGGNGGSQTGTVFNIPNSFLSAYYLIDILPSIVTLTNSAGSGGGGGGGQSLSSSKGYAGGGGGAGSSAGIIWIAANRMFIEGENEIQCNGGNGGDGGDAYDYGIADGGGGGGAGGAGGVIMLIYGEKTGTGTLQISGGTGGSGGAGASGGNNGSAGGTGQTGKTYEIQIQ